MFGFMDRFAPQVYAIVRIVFGFLFLQHGSQKLFGFPGELMAGIPAPIIRTAGPIELVGGTLVMLGLFSGYAAFLCSGLMAAAYFIAHQSQGLFPIANQGELAILYCFGFLLIATKGSGIWSIDAMRGASD